MEHQSTTPQLSLGLKALLTVAGLVSAILITCLIGLTFREELMFVVYGLSALGISLFMSRSDSQTIQYGVTHPAFLTALTCIGIGFGGLGSNITGPLLIIIGASAATTVLAGSKDLRQLSLFIVIGLLPFTGEPRILTSITAIGYIIAYCMTDAYNTKLKALPFVGECLSTIRFGTLLFAMLSTSVLYTSTHKQYEGTNNYEAIGIILALMVCALGVYLLRQHSKGNGQSFYTGTVLIVLTGMATAVDAQIALAILALTLSFKLSDRRGFIMSVVYLVYALVSFYYNTNMLLIYKSVSLMVSGALLLLLFYYLKRTSR